MKGVRVFIPILTMFGFTPLFAGVTSPSQAKHTAILPKTCSTEQVTVVDVKQDKKPEKNQDAADVLIAITCMQGLANRDNADKIYLSHVPIRIYWNVERDAGPGDPYTEALEDDLVPYPLTYAKLDSSREYPAFSYLLKRCAPLLKGKVLYSSDRQWLGTCAAAINACTFEGTLPVTDATDRLIKQEGVDLPLIADLRGKDDLQALEWSMERYLNHPKRNRRAMGFAPSAESPAMCDYWVATWSFCYALRPKEKQGADPTDPWFAKLLNTTNFDPCVLSVGAVEGLKAIPRIQANGGACVCGEIANASVTSSIPYDASAFRQPDLGKALRLDPNDVCITFNANDGDALDWLVYIAYKNLRNDPASASTPMIWKLNPYLVDLFPTMAAWFTRQFPDVADIAGSMNDGGAPGTPEGIKAWQETYRHYMAAANGNLFMLIYFGPFQARGNPLLDVLGANYIFRAYQGQRNGYEPKWALAGETVYSNQIGVGDLGPTETAEYVKRCIERAKPGTPLFINVRLGIDKNRDGATGERRAPAFPENVANTRRGILAATVAQDVMASLRSDGSIKRTLHFVPARDLVATYREWSRQAER